MGDAVRLDFSLRGREWRSPQGDVKYFNSLDVWKIEPVASMSSDELVAAVAPNLQHYIEADLS